MNWLSFVAGFVAAWMLAAAWAASGIGRFVLRARGQTKLAYAIGTAVVVALVLGAGYVAVAAMQEALVMMALNIRRY